MTSQEQDKRIKELEDLLINKKNFIKFFKPKFRAKLKEMIEK